MTLLLLLSSLGPRPALERKGPAEATVVIDFGGLRPAHSLGESTAFWSLDGTVEAEPGPAVWTVHLRLDNATVYEALERASHVANFIFSSEWYPGLGTRRITSIAGVSDGTEGRYWQFWVNGVYAQKGADLTPVSDGDVVRWEFRKPLQ